MPPTERLAIARVRAAGDAEWSAAWLACEGATWFHSPAWARIWSRYRRGALLPAPRAIEFSDGRSAVLPLCARPASRLRAGGHLSSPAGTYGGWIAAAPLEKEHAALLVAYLAREVPGLVWRVNPWDAHAVEVAQGLGQPEHTRALPLAEGFESLERGFAPSVRRAVRRA